MILLFMDSVNKKVRNLIIKSAIILFFTLIMTVRAEEKVFWCVQIASSTNIEELEGLFNKLPEENDKRIEKIGSFYTIRIGLFPTKKEAEELKGKLIVNKFKDIMVRKCYFIKERIISSEKHQKTQEQKLEIPETFIQIGSQPVKELKSSEMGLSPQESQSSNISSFLIYEEKLEKILKEIQKEILSSREFQSGNTDDVKRIFSINNSEPLSTYAEILTKIAKKDLLSHDIGLKLRAHYITNINKNFFEEDDTLPYNWRAYLGIEWDIFKDGFLENKQKIKALEDEILVDRLLFPLRRNNEMYPYLRNSIIYLFNEAKKEKLKKKIEFLTKYQEILNGLYFSGIVQHEEILNLEKEIQRAKNMLEEYINYSENLPVSMKNQLSNIDASTLPVLIIDIEKLNKAIADPFLRDKIITCQKSSLTYKYKSDYDLKLTPFIRYYTGDGNNNYFSFGVMLNLPLPVNSDKFRQQIIAEEKYIESIYDRNVRDSIHDVMNTYYEYSYKIDDLIKFTFQKQELNDKIYKNLIKFDLKDPNFSIDELAKLYIQSIDTDFEILHIKQLLYLKIAFILKYLPEDFSIFPYFTQLNIEREIKTNQRTGERSIYIWSDEFNNIDNKSLFWFLKIKSIKHALISLGSKTEREKLNQFIKLAGETFSIEALLGDNTLLFNREKLIGLLNEISSYEFKGIHIDVEPYTFSDWETQKIKYLELYKDMLKTINENPWRKGKIFSISIPVFYSDDFLKEIFPLVDKVYVMAYGTKKTDTVARWLKKLVEIDREKVVIAIRIKDFKFENEIEDFISALQKETGLSCFALHSLSDYFKNTGGNYEVEKKTGIP